MRPIFLRGVRRRAVQWDVSPVEICALAVALVALIVVAGASLASAGTASACDAPAANQVLVWSVHSDGHATCQYIDRDESLSR